MARRGFSLIRSYYKPDCAVMVTAAFVPLFPAPALKAANGCHAHDLEVYASERA